MKIASWNVNSIRQRLPNLLDWLARTQPDAVCLQELKCTQDTFPVMELRAAGYEAAIVGQKSYNGVAILARNAPAVVLDTLGDEQARYIEADIGGVRIANIYAPNGNPLGTEKFIYKLDWLRRLHARAKTLLDSETPFLITGDFNIIPEPADAHTPAAWIGDALYQPESRAAYRALKYLGLTDALRMHDSRAGVYTFWDYQAAAWQKDNGIRIDHALLSPQLADRCTGCHVDRDERGRENPSDHVPLIVTLR